MTSNLVFRRVVFITAAASAAFLGIAAAIGLSTGLFTPGTRENAGTTVDEHKSLPLAGMEQLSIDTVSADVRIVEAEGNSVGVWLHGSVGAATEADLPHLVVDQSGTSVTVRVHTERGLRIAFFWSRLALDVSIPRSYAQRVSVRTVSGSILVPAVRWSAVALSTTSGNIETGRMSAGHSDVSSVSGTIRVQGLEGDTTLHTTSGDIAATFASVPSRIGATSTSGQVALTLPPDAQFSLDAHSTSGDISCGFPLVVAQNKSGGGRRSLTGTVGNGSGMVSVRTTSGDIRILMKN
jgi:lia operon protein LiaG